ncbi:hypothetical protein [Heliothis virescens ascovirus 3g]|uniref:Uncharacterized protein n=1 Tax=Heliothis virescens ascovirus 3g TaxID=1246651 RepID=K4NVV6_9VIRU|nr:hypothetical protein F8204_gp184 [Heliothis virescens ascovirus 3g]AFV50436.1 hypothetical protein [Heliothis virescens ascovirus 3g]
MHIGTGYRHPQTDYVSKVYWLTPVRIPVLRLHVLRCHVRRIQVGTNASRDMYPRRWRNFICNS